MGNMEKGTDLSAFFRDHARTWRDNLYVYPVISRRAGGLSIGVNLNPDKACNFDCVYCQVDRSIPPAVRRVELPRLRSELDLMVEAAVTGEMFKDHQFEMVPASHRRIVDIAFSGDGEPTASPVFGEAVTIAADVRRERRLDDVRIVLITDAAYLQKPAVREALAVLDVNNGEIWAKLDAGTEEYFRQINRPNVPLATILANITAAARERPIVIQSLWMNVHGKPPPDAEVDAFTQRLREILAAGGRIKLVQIYTIARRTTEPFVTPLGDSTLVEIAARIRAIVDVPIATFGG